MKYILALGICLAVIGCGGPSEGEQQLSQLRTGTANPNNKKNMMEAAKPQGKETKLQGMKRAFAHRPAFR